MEQRLPTIPIMKSNAARPHPPAARRGDPTDVPESTLHHGRPSRHAILRTGLLLTVLAGAPWILRGQAEPAVVNFDYVRDLAAHQAATAYTPPDDSLPDRLASLTYDEYRRIRPARQQALWRQEDLPFRLQFFHRGGLYRERMVLHEFSATHVQVIPFRRAFFLYDDIKGLPWLRPALGYAGFRVLHPLHETGVFDEVAAWLGASYFRAIGRGQAYGLSARGLALDSGRPERREEFPRFTRFWIGKPAPDATVLTLYALLEGPSVTGAYEFLITPGVATVFEVRAELRFRQAPELPGIAPLSSMFWYGENTPRPAGEARPEVHDSDGLLVQARGGERLWRPLRNPGAPAATDFPGQPVAFGLLQRDRNLADYEDLEARYDLRPSAWIEPLGDWGPGRLRLVELPAGNEYGDNIVAFWVPAAIEAGRPYEYRYRVTWTLGEPAGGGPARVVATRESSLPDGGRRYWIDFTAPAGSGPAAPVQVAADADGGAHLQRISLERHPGVGGWRAVLDVQPAADRAPAAGTLHCALYIQGRPVSETWFHPWAR